MKKTQAIELAGGATELAKVLSITPGAISQWGEVVPELRQWQLKSLKPQWFSEVKKGEPLIVAPGASANAATINSVA